MSAYRPISQSPPSLSPRSSPPHSPTASLRALELSESFPDDPTHQPALKRHHRSDTVTSIGGFEFRANLLPLTLSGEGEDGGVHDGKADERHVSMLHGMALIMGTQVGSGIFSSPGVVVAEVGSVGASLLVWVMSALLAWTGASSFAELGCAIPLSGGAQAYLAYSFGPMTSYLYTWTAVSTLKPGSAAIISLIFGEYMNRMIYHAITADPESIVPDWTFKITAILAIILVSFLNVVSRSMGTNSSVAITIVKSMSLLFVGVLGMIHLVRNGAGSMTGGTFFSGTSHQPGNYAIALYSGLWSFDGWDACCFVAGEMKDTHRDLPRALHSSMTIVLSLFLAANISYFIVLDPSTVASTNTVALDFGRVTIGRLGAIVFSVLVSISCFGALNASFYTTARLIYAASRDHFLPSIFSRLHHRRRTPDYAVSLQATLTTFFIVFGGGFRTLLNFFSVTSWTFYLLTVLGLLVLRVKEPHLDRPYKTWIITPIIFCAVAMFLLLMPIFAAPGEALAAFLFMAAGVPMYYLTARSRALESNKPSLPDEGGLKATFKTAWDMFSHDMRKLMPGRRTGVGDEARTSVRMVDEGEERLGMLRGEQLEMSER